MQTELAVDTKPRAHKNLIRLKGPSLADVTRKLLYDRPRHLSYAMISEATGITVMFIHAFTNGLAKKPDCDKVQLLYEYMTGRQLKLD